MLGNYFGEIPWPMGQPWASGGPAWASARRASHGPAGAASASALRLSARFAPLPGEQRRCSLLCCGEPARVRASPCKSRPQLFQTDVFHSAAFVCSVAAGSALQLVFLCVVHDRLRCLRARFLAGDGCAFARRTSAVWWRRGRCCSCSDPGGSRRGAKLLACSLVSTRKRGACATLACPRLTTPEAEYNLWIYIWLACLSGLH